MTDITKNEIGTFIAACRKEKKLTQKQLGEKLNVTDRAVSKWETGRSFPDVSLMEPLCKELDISGSQILIKGANTSLIDLHENSKLFCVGILCTFEIFSTQSS